MIDLSFTPLCFFVVICVLTECVIAIRNYNDIDTKYIEELCPSDETQDIFLLNTGTRSALKIKSNKDNLTTDYNNCTVIIYSSGSGVILNLESTAFNHVSYEKCDDYVQVFPDIKNSTKLCGFKSSSFVSDGIMKFTFYRKYDDMPQHKFTVIATSYRKGDGECTSAEFKCDTGECIWKKFRCDGMANCPDGSDEFSSRNSMCITMPHFTLKPIDFDWNLVFPTSKSILEYRKSFNVTITAAVACAFLIFIFGVIRLVCHYHCAQRTSRRRRIATLRTFSIIRQRPDFQPQYECPPPPSYVSLINDNANNTGGGNPPAYSTVISSGEENSLTESNKDAKNNSVPGPPPPYEP